MVLPILDYSPIPTHMATRTRMLQLQRLQNKALRLVTNQRYLYTENTEAQHLRLNVQLISTRLRDTAVKIWEKLDQEQDQHYLQIKDLDNSTNMVHPWFPRSLKSLREEPLAHHHTI